MKIVTWNVNGIRALAGKGFHDFITVQDPDILCLQETKAHPDQCPPDLVHLPGRKSYWSPARRPGYSGTATYVKESVSKTTASYGMGVKKFDSEGRFVVTDHGDFILYNIYFPNGGSGEDRHVFKREFLQKLSKHLTDKIKSGRELVIVGDYNIAHKDIDVYDPKRLSHTSGFLPEERKWFSDFLELGFVDCFRYFYPEAVDHYTWWDYRQKAREVNRGWRIDHSCITHGLVRRLKKCKILADVMGSDHCPVMIELA